MLKRWLTFGVGAEQEDRFRQANLGVDIAQARICIWIIVFPLIAFAVNDYGFFGLSWPFYGLQAMRLVLLVHSVLLLKVLRGFTKYRSYDTAEFAWGLLVAVFTVVIAATRPQAFMAHTVVAVVAVFMTVLAIPNRFSNQLTLSLFYTVGETLVVAPGLWSLQQGSVTAVLSVWLASVIAVASGRELHALRRREFQAREEEEKAKTEVEKQLAEKEVLLKEIHHRVKNNMQVISSLVALQADRLQDTAMRDVLQDVTNRVRSMALVHEKLYQSADMARVEFAEYARSLLSYLWRAHGTAAAGVRLALDLEPVPLSVNAAVPCGLMLNELVSNALKHAFRGRAVSEPGSEVAVSLRGRSDGRVCLRVRDNGAGLPPGLDWRKADTLGLRLVQMLAGQFHAAVEVQSGEGTEFTITFGGSKT